MDILTNPDTWIALLTLTVLEIVLGIDNIVFISILSGKLAEKDQHRARQIGLLLAMGMRVLLLLAIGWVIGLTEPLFHIFEVEFSGRSIILIVGGLFLLGKATFEIHEKLEGAEAHRQGGAAGDAAHRAALRGLRRRPGAGCLRAQALRHPQARHPPPARR